MEGRLFADLFLQGEERFRLEVAEREIFQFATNQAHSQAVRDGRVDVQRLARDALLLGRLEILEGAHVVQPVGQLDQNDADVVHHGQQHLADVFGLARFWRGHVQAADFRDAFDEKGDFRSETFFDARDGILRVFDGVVEKRRGQRGGVHAHVGKDVGDFQEVRQVGLAGTAKLIVVALRGDFVGAAHHPGVFRGAVFAELLEQFFQAHVKLAHRAVAVETERQIARGRHSSVYARRGASGEGVGARARESPARTSSAE